MRFRSGVGVWLVALVLAIAFSIAASGDNILPADVPIARLIQQARRNAKPGDVFTRESRHVIRRLLARVFAGPEGKELKASIMDENPLLIKLDVNGRYPDSVPLSTVPPQVLQGLPKLPDEMEYRFIGNRLVLVDVHAHLIVDYVDNALPN